MPARLKFSGRPLIALMFMSILWGYSWTGMKIALLDCGPFTLVALRMTIAAACLLLILPLTGRKFWPTRIPELIRLGLVQTAGLMMLSTWAVAEGSPGRVAFLAYTMPFFTLALAWPLLGERIAGMQCVSCLLAASGLVVVVQPWNMTSGAFGTALAIGAGFAWAVSAVMVKQLQNRGAMDLVSMTAWQMVFGAVPILLLASQIPEAPIVWSHRFIVVLFAVSIVTSAFGWLLWLYVLNNMPAGTASMSTLAAPVIAVASSAFHTGERPALIEIFGMALITGALLVLSLSALRAHRNLSSAIAQAEGP